jgi:hypothetical protein
LQDTHWGEASGELLHQFGKEARRLSRLIRNSQTERSVSLRIPAGEIEQAVTSRLRQWLVDPGSVYQAIRLADPSAQRRPMFLDLGLDELTEMRFDPFVHAFVIDAHEAAADVRGSTRPVTKARCSPAASAEWIIGSRSAF